MIARRFLFLLAVPLIVFVQMRVDALAGRFPATQLLYLWSGEHVRRLFPGFEVLMADVYWLRTVQYFGYQRAYVPEPRYELLRPLVEITTALDPRFELAYRYGAIFIAERYPVGAGDPAAAVEILERGVRALPSSWRLRQDLGFFWFMFLNDARRAADVLLEAASLPGAPHWLRTLAADILGKGGERRIAHQMWTAMCREAEEGPRRDNACFHVEYLDALDTVDALNRLLQTIVARTGRPPGSLDELRRAGVLPRIPTDPSGVPFRYDPRAGTVSIAPESKFFRRAE